MADENATLRDRIGGVVFEEYVHAIGEAFTAANAALTAAHPVDARRALAEARAALGRADLRLVARAAPPTTITRGH